MSGTAGKVRLAHEWVDYLIEPVDRRRRHARLLVEPGGRVRIGVPYRCTRAHAEALLIGNAPWVLERLATMRRAARERREALVEGASLPLLDEVLRLRFWRATSRAGTPAVRRAGASLVIERGAAEVVGVGAVLEAWYRVRARTYLSARLVELGRPLSLVHARLSIRGQRSRWGSCSARGTISLNWRLMLLPSRLVDYVLVHELCHLRHLDHSAAFWATVAASMPDFAERRAALRAYRGALPL